MGKKGAVAAASTASGKATLVKEESAIVQESSEAALTGLFANDVPVLCHQQGIPPIAVCSRYSGCSSRFTVAINTDTPEQGSFTAIYIRGWLVTDTVAKIMLDALVSTKTLSSIHLWNVGLSSSALSVVVTLISEHNARELNVDGNNFTSATPVIDLLQCKSLVKLSMKSCNITDQFIEDISSPLTNNATLLHLNLSCNGIGDIGCTILANCLRLNRTLLTLSLTGNCIGDSGVVVLAKVLSRFPLTHEEVVQRRKLLSLQCKIEEGHQSCEGVDLQVERGRISSPRGKSPTSTTVLHKSLSKGDKIAGNKVKKGEQKKDEKTTKKEEKNKRALESRKGKIGKDAKTLKRGDQGAESPHPEPSQSAPVNPLLDLLVESEEGHLYLPGNTTLVYLALSYNAIGSAGMHSLLEALKMQSRYSHLGPGLLKLTLDHNKKMEGVTIEGDESIIIKEEIESLLAKKKSDDGAATEQEALDT